jgi:murein tripeptide amidase MpaA
MPPAGYLSANGIEACLQYLTNTYPTICQLVTLPEPSVNGATIHAIKLAKGGGQRHAQLLLGGVHARELVPPDALVSLALRLCQAYTSGSALTFGSRTYAAGTIKLLIEALDTYILPETNPDGRAFVQAVGGDPWWRKNRRSSGSGCIGVDINRNYDFLWSSGIGTSPDPCEYQVYKGSMAFSEPETRNVRWLLDTYPNIECMVDVHSYSQLFLYAWGDDDNQTTDPSMNFRNPAFDGLRGIPGDAAYREYIPAADRDWFVNSGVRVRDAIAAVRGRSYLVEQGVGLYPTSGTSDDYAYSRHFADGSKERVYAYTLEIGTEFQPTYAEALIEIDEVASGLIQFSIQCLCAVQETARRSRRAIDLERLRAWRDRLAKSEAGQRYLRLEPVLSGAFLARLGSDAALAKGALSLLEDLSAAIDAEPKEPFIKADLVDRAEGLLVRLAVDADQDVRAAAAELQADVSHFRDRSLVEGLERASRDQKNDPR